MMTQNPLARNKDVLAAVKCHMPITLCDEKTIVQFVSSRTATTYGKVPKDLASLVIPDCLKVVGTSLDHGDKTFLIFDSFDDDKECDRILIFSSHGMRQRAALIRTLVLKPDLLLLDEPFSALDYQTRLNVSNDIGQILRHSKKTAILVTHDLSEAISLADRVITLSSRPAMISNIVPIQFELDEDTPLHRRNAPEFKQYFNLLWKELNQS